MTWAALSPLALPDLPGEDRPAPDRGASAGSRAVLAAGPATVGSGQRPLVLPVGVDARDQARPTWINGAWLLWLGLVRLGYTEAAAALSTRLGAGRRRRPGCGKHHDRCTGRGMGASDFGWSSLILEMLDPDPRARDSFLGVSQSERPRSLAGSSWHRCRRHDPAGRDSDAGIPEVLNVQRMRRVLVRLLFFAGLVVVVIVTVPGLGSIRGRLAHGIPGWLMLAGCFRLASALLLRRLVSCGLRSADGAEGELPNRHVRGGGERTRPGRRRERSGDRRLGAPSRRQGRGRGWSSAPPSSSCSPARSTWAPSRSSAG